MIALRASTDEDGFMVRAVSAGERGDDMKIAKVAKKTAVTCKCHSSC